MRKEKSKRRFTNRHLIVDWESSGTLFYRMTKLQVRKALVNGTAHMTEIFYSNTKNEEYPVRRFPSGSIAIGCEHFNKKQASELKKWSRQK